MGSGWAVVAPITPVRQRTAVSGSSPSCKERSAATSQPEEPFGVQPASALAGESLQPEGAGPVAAAFVPGGTCGSAAQSLVVLGPRHLREPPRLLEHHAGLPDRRSPARRLRRPGARPACFPLGPTSGGGWICPARLLALRALPDVRTSVNALLREARAGRRAARPIDDCRPPHCHLAHGVRPRRPAPGGNHPQRRLLESGRGRRGGGDRRRA